MSSVVLYTRVRVLTCIVDNDLIPGWLTYSTVEQGSPGARGSFQVLVGRRRGIFRLLQRSFRGTRQVEPTYERFSLFSYVLLRTLHILLLVLLSWASWLYICNTVHITLVLHSPGGYFQLFSTLTACTLGNQPLCSQTSYTVPTESSLLTSTPHFTLPSTLFLISLFDA